MARCIWKWVVAVTIISLVNTVHAGCFNANLVNKAIKETVGSTFQPIVIAHRGLWAKEGSNDNPENSLIALKSADRACIEAVELDVKATQDGVPFLMHDFNLGRTTNVYDEIGGDKFNPENNSGANPQASTLNWETVNKLKLLSPDRSEITEEKVASIKEVYDYYFDQRMTTLLVFDIKTQESAIAIAKLLNEDTRDYGNGLTASDFTIFKLNATIYPFPEQFVNDLQKNNITIQPMVMAIYTTNMLQVFSDKGWDIKNSLQAWIARDKMVEINLKQPDGLLSDLMKLTHDAKTAIGVFNAIPDYNGPGPIPGDIPQDKAFYNNNGTCCYQLSDKFATFEGVSDTDDERGDRIFIYGKDSQNFSVITTDTPLQVITELDALGLRDTLSYGGPQANVAILAWDGESGSSSWGGGPVCIFDNPSKNYGWMYACILAQPYKEGYDARLVVNALEPTGDSQFGSDRGTKILLKDKSGNCLNYNMDSTDTFFDSNCSDTAAQWFRTKDRLIRTVENDGYCLSSKYKGLYWGNSYGITYIAGCEINDSWQKWVFTKDPWTSTPLPNDQQ
ncbi:glycerophosphodiester phosphodiesterase family protein [Aeromonas enteropelogenes]|uniref:glycerophosphodiester phosphodiesterase family protein n=1 Tax=Aeromonas enteropelogenes TaxID=29489 RepID=UPI0009E2E034|nr:glycerophosphodiester phosphodiesterase family protein [Aeromonas enteropelogenes]UBH57093.1 glycerophosphodiester phosphodiesterase family protein [Aeromonas enteropelogenes]